MSGATIEQRSESEFQVNDLKRNEAIHMRVENFDLHIKRTDEGIVVDIYDFQDELNGESLGSTYAFDSETLVFQEGD